MPRASATVSGPRGAGRKRWRVDKSGIQIVDVASRKTMCQLPRKGIVEQLVVVADASGSLDRQTGWDRYWNIARLDAAMAP